MLTRQVWRMVQIWTDWREFRLLPLAGKDIGDHPAFVYQTIAICEREMRRIENELARPKEKAAT